MPTPIEEARAKHAERLLELPGVVSVGVGRDSSGRPAIIVGLDGSSPTTAEQLPRSLEGHPVISRIVGSITAH